MSSVVAVLVDGVLWQQLPVSDGHNALGSRDNSWVVMTINERGRSNTVGLLSQGRQTCAVFVGARRTTRAGFVHAAQAMLSRQRLICLGRISDCSSYSARCRGEVWMMSMSIEYAYISTEDRRITRRTAAT